MSVRARAGSGQGSPPGGGPRAEGGRERRGRGRGRASLGLWGPGVRRRGQPPGGTVDSRPDPRRGSLAPPAARATARTWGRPPRTFCSRSMQQGAGRSGHSQSPVREGRRQGVRLGPAPGRRVLGATRAESAVHRAVASSSLSDSPAADRVPGLRREGGRAGEGGGAPDLRELGRAGRKGASALQGSGFPFAQPREGQCAWGRRGGKAEGLHLFLSHCSLAGKEMTTGVSRSGAASTFLLCHTCLALPCPGPAGRVHSPLLTPHGPCRVASLSGSLLAPGPLPPSIHCPLCAPLSHSPEGPTEPMRWTDGEDGMEPN